MRGYLALTRSELKLFLREPFSIVFVLVFPLMMLLLLSAIFGNDESTAQEIENGMLVWRGVVPVDFYTAGSVGIVVAAFGIMTLPIQISGYREQGILRRMQASSVPVWTVFVTHLTVGLVTVLAGGTIMALISWLAFSAMLPEDLLGVIVAVIVGAVAFSAIGLLLAVLVSSSRAAQGIGLLLFFGMWLISGAAAPRALLPQGLLDFGEFLPLTHLVFAIQDPWFGFGWNFTGLGILAGFAIAAAIPALWFFQWD